MKVTDEMVDAAVATYEKGQKTVGESYHGAMRKAIEAAIQASGGILGSMSASDRGKLGAAARAEKLTPKRRSQIAKKAAKARWSKNA